MNKLADTPTPPTHPRLVGDIGGTNARFALVRAPGAEPSEIQVLPGAEFPTLLDALRHYLRTTGARPRQACLGVATALQGDRVEMTNSPWSFSARQVAAELGLARLLLVNDFTALALGVPTLAGGQLRRVGAGSLQRARPDGPIAILGPGTGLGTSALVPVNGRYIAVPGEGGHVTLAAATPEEAQVVAWLWKDWPHVSAERLVCGPGLVLLHRALAAVRGLAANPRQDAAEIARAAIDGSDELSIDAVDMFCAMLGTVASNLALTLGATGGVYLGGGMVPALGDYFHRTPFRERFEAKGRYSGYLARIPTHVIHAPYVALSGAACALDLPQVIGSVDARP